MRATTGFGVPAASANFAYISCGTWSLVGVEVDAPVLARGVRVRTVERECLQHRAAERELLSGADRRGIDLIVIRESTEGLFASMGKGVVTDTAQAVRDAYDFGQPLREFGYEYLKDVRGYAPPFLSRSFFPGVVQIWSGLFVNSASMPPAMSPASMAYWASRMRWARQT